MIEENKYEYSYVVHKTQSKVEDISFEPSFGTIIKDVKEDGWIYRKGKWNNTWEHTNSDGGLEYWLLAIELTLSN